MDPTPITLRPPRTLAEALANVEAAIHQARDAGFKSHGEIKFCCPKHLTDMRSSGVADIPKIEPKPVAPQPPGDLCSKCGGVLKQAGTCKVCTGCGDTSGGCS